MTWIREFLAGLTRVDAATAGGVRHTRDLRLDFFRGLALWFIFLDHIPDNIVSWLTVRNYGFSDATEIFVFISGYTAVIAYSGIMRQGGWVRAAARILGRVWQLYVAHMMLFVVLTASVAWTAVSHSKGDTFLEHMNLTGLGQTPYETLVQAALLKFRPLNLDVLPLYIVLLLSFPLMLPLVVRRPWAALSVSLAVYVLARVMEWNLPGHPEGNTWFFNPFAWQLVFYAGATLASTGHIIERLHPARHLFDGLAIAYLAAAAFVTLGWYYPPLEALLPDAIGRLIYPIDKTSVDPLRLIHFLAVAYLVARLTPADSPFLQRWYALPLRRCGEFSLAIFCLGTFLSFVGYVVVATYADVVSWPKALDVVVSIAGLAIMVAAAYFAHWYKSSDKSSAKSGVKRSDTIRRPSSAPASEGAAPETVAPETDVPNLRPAEPAQSDVMDLPTAAGRRRGVLTLALTLGLAALLLALAAPGPALAGPEKCPAAHENLVLGTTLPRVKLAIRERKKVVIVALGSSSTQGHGATAEVNTYPRQMEISLARQFVDVRLKFAIFNKGIGGQDVTEMLERLDRDVIARDPDLVIWQAGTNAALKGMPLDVFKLKLSAGVERVKKAGADVVLMTPQYVPAVIALSNEDDYIGAMETIARDQGVGVFKRFQIMRDWVTGEHMPYAQFMISDGLHLNDFGQRCMGKLLAKAIEETIRD
ncbi:OpgC domain-containing protein [Vineibacter terrae]|uniref:OpgC domain-containing protein n=1 Tax=Vineibacter terrae TaxID=2586908 RepID=UPI002E2EEE04|nr:OpgC domain-containing protein [Vineibacter terrae]HEX2885216.1 OpgC domain-containing protein [Vineibacter terrae]